MPKAPLCARAMLEDVTPTVMAFGRLAKLLVGIVSMALSTGVYASCDVHELMSQQEYGQATACIQAGADPNARDHRERGPLNRLLWYPRGLSVLNQTTLPFIEALVDAGADLNYRPPSEKASAFEALLEFGVHIKARPLVRRMLLRPKNPADPNASVLLLGNPPDVKVRMTPLLWAIKSGETDMVAFLLDKRVDPNHIPEPGMGTPLHHAIHYNQAEVIRLLVRHGADVQTVTPSPVLYALNTNFILTAPETLRVALELGAMQAIPNHEGWLLHQVAEHVGHEIDEEQLSIIVHHEKIDFKRPDSTFLERLLVSNQRRFRSFGKDSPTFRAAFFHALQSGAPPGWIDSLHQEQGIPAANFGLRGAWQS